MKMGSTSIVIDFKYNSLQIAKQKSGGKKIKILQGMKLTEFLTVQSKNVPIVPTRNN